MTKAPPGTTDRSIIKAAIDNVSEDRLDALREIVEIVRTGERIKIHAVKGGFCSDKDYKFEADLITTG